MTQRKWTTEDGWDVLAGWDRPLQRFFLGISRICPSCGGSGHEDGDRKFGCNACDGRGEQHAFNNLDNAAKYPMGAMELADVVNELERHVTAWPPALTVQLQIDQHGNLGNEVSSYEPIGRLKEGALSGA
jgi:hypothetical protein